MAYASGGSKNAAARVGQSNGLDDSRMGNSNRWPARLYRSFSVMPWSAAKVGLASKHSLHIIGCWLFPQCRSGRGRCIHQCLFFTRPMHLAMKHLHPRS